MSKEAKSKSLSDDDVETVGEIIGDLTGIPAGGPMGKLVSRYGKHLIEYYLLAQPPSVKEETSDDSTPSPPFIVVGLGRCGCHITAELAEMISSTTSDGKVPEKTSSKGSFLNMFRTTENPPVLRFQPAMLVGDIDETGFQDVDGLMQKGGVSQEIASSVLKLSYYPIAEGGVGNVPLFAEFLTRGLLALSDSESGEQGAAKWAGAKTFLTESFFRFPRAARLVFYIFSSGGGTGSGSAAEIMRTQRYAMSVSTTPDRQIYFTGVAILPDDLTTNRRRLINTGRMLVQYLADLNIELASVEDYDKSPRPRTGTYVKVGDKENKLMPWDGVALISNSLMSRMTQESSSHEELETNGNQYIAQQMFNLAAAQFSAASFERDADAAISKKNFQAIRLDPQDLKAGLLGPYAICFSAANSQEIAEKGGGGIDRMFLRAIGLPSYNENVKRGDVLKILEGISASPLDPDEYSATLREVIENLGTRTSEKGATGLLKSDFAGLNVVPFFQKCPRVVFVFTAPQDGVIPAALKERLGTLISWLFPNLAQFRGAIVRGTTSFYTLSIYVEGSVILCPSIQSAIKNYLKLCWKQRRAKPEDFSKAFDSLVDQEPPIEDAAIGEWLGLVENYGVEVPNFDGSKEEVDNRWQDYLQINCKDNVRKEMLRKHTVESSMLSHQEIASAMRYLNYIKHMTQPEIV